MTLNDITPVNTGDIFRLYGYQYRIKHKLPLQQQKAMFAIQNCRTPVLGSHADKCEQCGHIRISNNSCRNRHCPQCQHINRTVWVDKIAHELLATKYFHIVFTIPSELNRVTLVNQKTMYDILFKSASESILMLAKNEKRLNAHTGMVAVLHTWGQNLSEHPHLHTLVPAGGWNENLQRWINSGEKFFLPSKVISAVFKAKFISFFKLAYQNNELKFEGEIKHLKLKSNFRMLVDTLYKKKWVVFCEKPFKNHIHIINYLGRYSHSVAIDNSRIKGIVDNDVVFNWKDYNDGGKNKIMKLHAEEFIRRYLLHVLPKRYCKIRYYGIFANRCRKRILTLCRKALKQIYLKSVFTGLTWQKKLLMITGIDFTLCSECGTGLMKPIVLSNVSRGSP